MVQGLFLHVTFKANIHISLPSFKLAKNSFFSPENGHMFLSKMADFPESLLLGITHWCIIKEFPHFA